MAIVLIADDDQDIRQLISVLLSALGVQVVTAEDGEEAVAETARVAPDLIVMDMNMPRMTGYEATRAIRKSVGRQPKILGLTANDRPGDYDEAYEAGCDGFMSKPFAPEDLIGRIQSMLAAP